MSHRPSLVRAADSLVARVGASHALKPSPLNPRPRRAGLTLVEMLTALAVTLLLMAAVVTVFANVTSSVTRRRATLEMSGQLRTVREQLSRDLEGATCTALPWREPEANEGYIEIIEGPQTDLYPSVWLYNDEPNQSGAAVEAETYVSGLFTKGVGTVPGIDLAVSSLPGSNLSDDDRAADEEGRGRMVGSYALMPDDVPTDGRGLGDGDDILMLTVRNEQQPFVGRIPPRPALVNQIGPGRAGPSDLSPGLYAQWGVEEFESPLAEVVWFAFENPPEREDAQTFAFGEPGYRTVYRRALLIAPMLDYQIRVGVGTGAVVADPGVVRVLDPSLIRASDLSEAIAALISFQERYDLSVRLEWDPRITRWVLRANTLGDLTKRENRFEHHGFVPFADNLAAPGRYFPFAAVSRGCHSGQPDTLYVTDPELGMPNANEHFVSVTEPNGFASEQQIVAFEPDDTIGSDEILEPAEQQVSPLSAGRVTARPLVLVDDRTDVPAIARAVLNEDGSIVGVTLGFVPLGGDRRGDDVMMTDALAFDVRVYDPLAPVYAHYPGGVLDSVSDNEPADRLVAPGDPAWEYCFWNDMVNLDGGANTVGTLNGAIVGGVLVPGAPGGGNNDVPFTFQQVGAYVDLGYGLTATDYRNSEGAAGVGDLWHSNGDESAQFVRDTSLYGRYVGDHTVSVVDSVVITPLISSEQPWFLGPGRLLRTRAAGLPTQPNIAARLGDRVNNLAPGYAIYDTWSWHYERNGVDEDFDNTFDEGVDGLENQPSIVRGVAVNSAAIDDPGERETRPPYDRPLRGVQVQLRVYERDSRQVREAVVRESFVPE